MKYFIYLFFICTSAYTCKSKEKPGAATTPENAGVPNMPIPAGVPASSNGITQMVSVMDSISGKIVQKEKPINALSSAIGPAPVVKTDPVKPVVQAPNPKTPQDSRVLRILTSNYWVIWALVRINDQPANRQNQGAWYKFKPDGTYDYGFFEQKIGAGTWTFNGRNATLFLDSELLGDDREWTIKIGTDEDVMIWIGTDRFVTTGINTKLQNYLFIPKNRKEMGISE